MSRAVILDSGPIGLLTYSRASGTSIECNRWLRDLSDSGATIVLPEIVDYEIRRELLRLQQLKGLLRLETLRTIPGVQYEPITTDAMRMAAELWALSRREGRPTADPKALDCDVILVAQARALQLRGYDVIVATGNVAHFRQSIAAAEWHDINATLATMPPSKTD